eukprot:1101775-Rhodomonas_salina.1
MVLPRAVALGCCHARSTRRSQKGLPPFRLTQRQAKALEERNCDARICALSSSRHVGHLRTSSFSLERLHFGCLGVHFRWCPR